MVEGRGEAVGALRRFETPDWHYLDPERDDQSSGCVFPISALRPSLPMQAAGLPRIFASAPHFDPKPLAS